MFHAARNKPHGHKEKEDRRNQGKADEGHHELGPQPSPQDLSLSLKDQLDEISNDQEDQEKDQDDVNINQREDDDVLRDGDLSHDLGKLQLDGGEQEDQNGEDPDDEELVAPSSRFWRDFLFHFSIYRFGMPNALPFGGWDKKGIFKA